MTNENSISKRLSFFPALPEVAPKLLDLLADRNTSEFDLIALIDSEEGMSETLLRMINQVMFGGPKLTTLAELLDLLGLPRMRFAVLAYAINRFYAESGAAKGRTTGLSTKISWDHALAVAYLGVELARRVKYPRLEEILLAGLAHDIGRLMMVINQQGEYNEVLGEIYGERVNIVATERSRLGFSHEEAGALLVARWNLPDSVQTAVRFHHNCEEASEHQTVVHIISLANQIAVAEGTSFERGDPIDPDHNISLHFLQLTAADLDAIVAGFREQIQSFKAIFQG